MSLATQATPAMHGDCKALFTHEDLEIEVHYPHPTAAKSPERPSPPVHRNQDHLSQPAFWGAMGALLHSSQASSLQNTRIQFREAIKMKQAEVAEAGMCAEHKAKPKKGQRLAPVQVPSLKLDTVFAMGTFESNFTRNVQRGYENYDSILNSRHGPFSPTALRGAVTDREMRHRWLESTERFSRYRILHPFATARRVATPAKQLRKQEIEAEEKMVRTEARRINSLLHGVNVSLMKGTATFKDAGAQQRHNVLEDLQQEMKTQHEKLRGIVMSSAKIDGDTRFDKVPHRYDFLKANAHGTAQTRTHFRGARSVRNSIEWTEKADSALCNNARKRFDLAERVRNDLTRREQRLQAGDLHKTICSDQTSPL